MMDHRKSLQEKSTKRQNVAFNIETEQKSDKLEDHIAN
jgi:hypothetical protein